MKEKLFLIRKRGFYYRSNAQGYVEYAHEAGRFTEAEAIAHRDSCDPGELELVAAPAAETFPAMGGKVSDIVSAAVAAERERCAVIVERGLGRTNTTIARMIREGGA